MPRPESVIDLTAPAERAFLVALEPPRDDLWPVERRLAELGALAETAGAMVVGFTSQRRAAPDPVWYLGRGRAAELADEKAATDFSVLIVDDELRPNQQRSLEKLLDCKVLDRSALILDIFARHATTHEGRLQVELAQLEYHLPRLTRMWTHLSRTAGGIGTRGPGESQLETDRRLIRERIKRVQADLDDVKRQRRTSSRQRDRSEIATVALVGYTNAGKSTLLNALAGSEVFVADMVFATLDPTARRMALPSGQRIVLTDTVGFINKLPHDLVEAFQATLEEVLRADLLVEVVDASDPDFVAQQTTVQAVLDDLGAGDKPRLTVYNKLDLLQNGSGYTGPAPESDGVAFVSASQGTGLEQLREVIEHALRAQMVTVDAVIPYERGDLAARARQAGQITEVYEPAGIHLSGQLPPGLAGEITAADRSARPRATVRPT
jgi:GTP-binding protein HflX